VAEPYRVPDAPNWIGDLDGLTAVTWTPTLGAFGALLDRGSGYVAVEWAEIAVVAVYVSPNIGLAAFGDFWTMSVNTSKGAFPARCWSSETSMPTRRSGGTPRRTPEEDG
jgi:hypothetical protein